MTAWDRFTAAAHAVVPGLPADWHGYAFEAAPGLGVSVTGLVVTATYSRGPRKGELNFAKGDLASRLTIFVPADVLDRCWSAGNGQQPIPNPPEID